jgi:hypothetical protein
MENIHICSSLNVEYPEKNIFYRLGGNMFKTSITSEEKLFYSTLARSAFSFCLPRGAWRVMRISRFSDDGILLENGFLLSGKKFASLVSGRNALWFGAVTVGTGVILQRDSLEKVSERAVYDAVASETADSAMDMLFALSGAELQRRGAVLDSGRYSPGYGDMSLENQKLFFQLLDMQKMGVNLTEHCYMTPEKSVTAVAGVTLYNQ